MKIKQNNFISISKFLTKNKCEAIIKEIDRFNKFDDFVMSGRKRINKGSKNFKFFLKASKNSKYFFNKINTLKFYKNINHKLGNVSNPENKWSAKLNNLLFSKVIFDVDRKISY